MPPVARPATRSWRKSAILYPLRLSSRKPPKAAIRDLSPTLVLHGSRLSLRSAGMTAADGGPLLRSLTQLRQFAGDLLLTGDDLGDVADAVDVTFVVPGGLEQDAGLVLRRDRQAVHGLGKRLTVKLAELLGDERRRIDAGVALDAVVVR